MIHLKQTVIVEGKYDKIKLSSIIDALIIPTDGFRIFKDKEKMSLIASLAEKNGVIIITDSDRAGFLIRNHIKGCIKGGNITNIYMPDIFGKEKRKTQPSKEGKLGVEGIDIEILLNTFKNADVFALDYERKHHITKEILFDDGFIGRENSYNLRQKLYRQLSLPEHLSTKALTEVLNSAFTYEDYRNAVNTII